jgi:DNA-binding GntR family transcriptional regulator
MYIQIATDYRAKILDGTLPGDAKLPSESGLMTEYGVSRIVARRALDVLRNEGLIVSHPGKGSYVKNVRRIVRDSSTRYSRRRAASTSPFKSDATQSGQQGGWDYNSKRVKADAETAIRLAIEPGDPVMMTTYLYRANGEPVQLSTSYEPLAITGGTSVEFPEDGAAVGVIARMDAIDVHITQVIEKVTARAARPNEIEQLKLTAHGTYVLVIERTHFALSQPVETSEIVFPGDRYELTYRVPVDD